MGYRSDVGIALTGYGVERLHKELERADEKTREAVTEFLDSPDKYFRHHGSGAEAYVWTLCKWYEDEPLDYPEVAFFQELFRKLDCQDYRFIRIGEDANDSEIAGTFFSNPFKMRIVRAIEIEGNFVGEKE